MVLQHATAQQQKWQQTVQGRNALHGFESGAMGWSLKVFQAFARNDLRREGSGKNE